VVGKPEGNIQLRRPSVAGTIILKWVLGNMAWRYSPDLFFSGQRSLDGSC
jgi:hypothetical protein